MKRRVFRIGAAAILAVLAWSVSGCGSGRQVDAPSPVTAVQAGSADGSAVSRVNTTESASSASSVPESSPSAKPEPAPSSAKPEKPAGTRKPDAGNPPAAGPSPSASPSPAKQASEAARTVTVSIAGNAEWGTVVAAEDVQLKQNDTVADVLIRVLKAHKLAFDASGSGPLFYVKGIDGLYEFDDGPTSGWKYRVNGKVPDVGAGSFGLKPGDRVEWFYTSEDKEAENSGKGRGSAP